jgi:hypothetical protein
VGEMRNACKISVRKYERRFRRPRHKWKNNIRIGIRETGWKVWTGFLWFRIGTSGGIL